MKPRMLTIKGETQSMAAWSRVPGAAKYNTIADRVLRLHRDHEQAVFGPSLQGKVRRGHGRSRGRRTLRAAISGTRTPSPHPPTWGGFASYPIEALSILRRVA